MKNAWKRNEGSRLFKPAKSVIALVIVLGLVSGVFFRYLYDYRPWVTATETGGASTVSGSDAPNVSVTPTAVPINTSGLTANQLLQRITDSAAGNITTSEAYSGIPTAQLGGLTFEEYQRYISLIDLAMETKPSSFSPMTTSERDRQIARIVSVDPDYREIAENSSYHWIEGANNGQHVESISIALQTNANGLVYMNRDWIRRIIDLYDYAQTYFGTIDQQNAEILSKMIYSTSTTTNVKLAKAQSVINYYTYFKLANQGLKIASFDISQIRYTVTTNFVPSDPLAPTVGVANPSLPDYEALSNAVEDGSLDAKMIRSMQISQDLSGAYRISDPIPELTLDADFAVLVSGNHRLTLNSEVNSVDMNALFGDPFLVIDYNAAVRGLSDDKEERTSVITPIPIGTYSEDGEAVNEEEDTNFLIVRYEDVELLIQNHEELDDETARGILVGITFAKGQMKTERGLSTRTSLDQLLLTYNFIDQTSYILKNKNLDTYIYFPQLDDESDTDLGVQAIRIGRIRDLAYDIFDDGVTFASGDDLQENNGRSGNYTSVWPRSFYNDPANFLPYAQER